MSNPAGEGRIRAGAATQVGCVRDSNEDRYLIDTDRLLFVIADGMGGMQGGERASELAVEAISEEMDLSQPPPMAGLVEGQDSGPEQRRLRHAIEAANRRILEEGGRDPDLRGMGSTVLVAWAREWEVHVAHAGDCRAYLIRYGRLQQITKDHSLAMQQVEKGKLTLEEARDHPLRNELVNSLGQDRIVVVEGHDLMMESGDWLVLCTDGVWDMLLEDEMLSAMAGTSDPEAASQALVEAAVNAGGRDNATAIVIDWGEVNRNGRLLAQTIEFDLDDDEAEETLEFDLDEEGQRTEAREQAEEGRTV